MQSDQSQLDSFWINNKGKFTTITADPPWQFRNRTVRGSPEESGCFRYSTMSLEEICDLPVNDVATKNAHLYLWVPNSMLLDGLKVMEAWGFRYVNLRNWLKLGSDGNPIRNGLGWYTRGCTEPILFGIKGKLPCNAEGKSLNNIFEGDVNTFGEPRREHSRKPDSFYEYVQKCSPGPYLDLFGRQSRENWAVWGNEAAKFNED